MYNFERKRPHKQKRIMNKKEYKKPAMRVVKMQQRVHILAGSPNSQSNMQIYSNDAINDENAVW